MFRRHLPGFRALQEVGVGSQAILFNAERHANFIARTMILSESPMVLATENIRKTRNYIKFLI